MDSIPFLDMNYLTKYLMMEPGNFCCFCYFRSVRHVTLYCLGFDASLFEYFLGGRLGVLLVDVPDHHSLDA